MSSTEQAATVYVHGAGRQEDPTLLKRRLDGAIYGGPQGQRTHLAYYSDVLHRSSPPAGGLEGARSDAVAMAANPYVSREDLAEALAGGPRTGFERAADDRPFRLAKALLARADDVAAADPQVDMGGLEGRRFPDTGFRILVGILARDVIQYLFDGAAEAVRSPVREAVRMANDPVLVIAHSLGTIVTFDVLSEPEFADRDIVRLVTLGSPLGIENVQDELRDRAGQPHPVPSSVRDWHNLADRRDPVASGQEIAGEYQPNQHGVRITDDLGIRNQGFLHHALTGYLGVEPVRRAIGVA